MLIMKRMNSNYRYILCSGFLLVFLCSTSIAQDDFINSSGQQETMQNEGHVEKKYVFKLETAPPPKKYCHVSVDIGYLQKNADVMVNMTLENPDCAASGGSYTVAIKFRDENNELQTAEYEETWERQDDQPLQSRREYFIGENVDLINARVKRLKCVCAAIRGEGSDTLPPTDNQ